MRFMTGVATLTLMLALTGSAHADDWYRLNLRAPILFSGGEVLPPDGGGNTGISITIDETALIEGSAKGRQYGDLSVPVTISGTDASHTVSLEGLAGASWVPTGSAYGSGAVSWPGAAEGTWSPTIVVKDGDDNVVATAQLELEILPALTASVPQNSYTVDKGDELTIQASAGNAIGNVLWGSDDDLPEWIDLDALTGELEVGTSASNSASGLKLTAVDQFDNMTATTTPFSVTVNGTPSDYWVTTLGGVSGEKGYSITQGADGSIYVLAQTNNTGAGSYDLLLVKYNINGTLDWKKTLGGGQAETGGDIVVGKDGAVYVTGHSKSIGVGGGDLFVTQFTPDGVLGWTRTIGRTGDDYGRSIIIGADGSIYVYGDIAGGPLGSQDIILAKYTSSGDLLWKNILGGTNTDTGFGIVIGADGGIYVTGYTRSTGAGGSDLLIAKYNSGGALDWAKTLGGVGDDQGRNIAIGADGSVYVSGFTASTGAGGNDLLIAKYNSGGALDWAKTLGGDGHDFGWGITTGADGSLYVTGQTTSTGAGGNDLLVAKYNTTGVLDWVKTLGGVGNDDGQGIVIGSDDAIYVAGGTTSTGVGDTDLLVARLPANGGGGMSAGSLIWQEGVLSIGENPSLTNNQNPSGITNRLNPAGLTEGQYSTGLSEGSAAALTGGTIQFEE